MINTAKIKNINIVIVVIIILLLPVYLLKENLSTKIDKHTTEATFVGRSNCIECHAVEYEQWTNSDHDKAMDHANDSTVLGNFNNVELVSNGHTHKFYKREGKFYVLTDGENNEMQEFEIKYTFGYTPLQQYLVEFDGGRLQSLSLTWNTLDEKWYNMVDSIYKNENINHTNWLHWTNQAQNWNSMCADCHSTNLKKAYDANTNTYHTTWSEIDVSCEACHGPASKHIEWANLPEYSKKGHTNYGLVLKTSNIDNKQYVDNCARCHSRRTSISDNNFDNSSILNHIIPTLPTEPFYYIDGQILDEDYVYGSFTQSRMYMNDVKCNDCHNVHSTKLLYEDNELCLQCHKANDYDTYEHHFHKQKGEGGRAVISESGVKYEVGEGTKCINCHMHAQYFMGVDYRNDHSFRIPRPDLSEKLGTPNACNQCHSDKSNQWAQGYIEKWYGKSRHYQYGQLFALAQTNDYSAFEKLKGIIYNNLYPEIIRSTAISYIGQYYQHNSKNIIFDMLQNPNSLIRLYAVRSLALNDNVSLANIFPLLYDENKAVRIECANKLQGIESSQIPENYKETFKRVNNEYLSSLIYNSDFPGGKVNLANYYYSNKQYNEAEKFYLSALKQDNELGELRINLAYLYSATHKPQKAEALFKSYLNDNPTDGNVLYPYALLLSELKRYKESLQYLLKAAEYSPNNARIDYNIAMMYDFFNEKQNAEKYLKLAIANDQNSTTYYIELLNFYIRNNNSSEIKKFGRLILNKFPSFENRNELEALIESISL